MVSVDVLRKYATVIINADKRATHQSWYAPANPDVELDWTQRERQRPNPTLKPPRAKKRMRRGELRKILGCTTIDSPFGDGSLSPEDIYARHAFLAIHAPDGSISEFLPSESSRRTLAPRRPRLDEIDDDWGSR